MAICSSILAWEIPWTEEPGGLQSIGSQKSQTQLSDSTTTKAMEVTSMLVAQSSSTFLRSLTWD